MNKLLNKYLKLVYGADKYNKEGDRVKIKLLTKWYEKELVCCCPKCNRCLKDHNCEELTFTLEPTYKGIDECFKNSEKKR